MIPTTVVPGVDRLQHVCTMIQVPWGPAQAHIYVPPNSTIRALISCGTGGWAHGCARVLGLQRTACFRVFHVERWDSGERQIFQLGE